MTETTPTTLLEDKALLAYPNGLVDRAAATEQAIGRVRQAIGDGEQGVHRTVSLQRVYGKAQAQQRDRSLSGLFDDDVRLILSCLPAVASQTETVVGYEQKTTVGIEDEELARIIDPELFRSVALLSWITLSANIEDTDYRRNENYRWNIRYQAALAKARTILSRIPVAAGGVEETRSVAEREARVRQEWKWGHLTLLGVADFLKREGFTLEASIERAKAITGLDRDPVAALQSELDASRERVRELEAAFNYVCGLLPGGIGAIDREADNYVLNCMVNVGELKHVRSLKAALSQPVTEGEG